MPTKSPAKQPVRRPVRRPIKPVRPMGSKPVIIVVVVILVLIVGAMAYYFFKSPPKPAAGPSAGQSQGAAGGPGADGASSGGVEMAVAKAKLQFETVDGKTIIKVIIDKAAGTNGREVTYKFDWTMNGQPAGDGTDRLSGFKRGDRVGVKVTPVEGDKPGQARFLDVLVNNMPPQVAESKQVSFDGKTFVYQVTGSDPDGDTLTYALEDAPEGMTINSQTGLVTWQVKENDYGEKIFKIKINDGKSGFATHPVKVDIPKPAEEQKPSEQQK
jgi:hypothetical protein